jgi:hypothetical protein
MAQDLAPAQGFGSEIDEACEEIHAATKGWGANKQKVIDALATKDSTERAKLAIRYKELHNVQLSELMKKEFSGHFGLALKFLALPPNEAEAAMLRNATAKIGASVNIVWSVLVGRTNEEIELLKKTYFKKYDKDMSKMLAHELTGNMERLIFNCIQGGAEEYNPQFHTKEKAIEDAEAIYSKGQGRWVGTEERGIFKILCAAPPEYLREIDHAYSEKYGYTLLKALHKEMGGHMGEACEHLVAMKLKPFEAIATLFKTVRVTSFKSCGLVFEQKRA